MTSLIDILKHGIPNYNPFDQADGYHLDLTKAQTVIDFFKDCLCLTKGKWGKKPFVLEPWQQAIIGNLYGWVDDNNNLRYQECGLWVPKKNGKSELCAGIASFELFCGREFSGEIYSAAAAGKQAALVFSAAKKMIGMGPLKDHAEIQQYTIRYDKMDTVYKYITAETGTAFGINPSCVIIDELLAINDPNFVDAMTQGSGARENFKIIYITTSDYERESICNLKYKYACEVRDNKGNKANAGYDPRFLPVIYEAKEPKDNKDPLWWTREEVFKQANPNHGISIQPQFLRRECDKALAIPSSIPNFKRFFLNLKTSNVSAWLDMVDWDKCTETYTEDDLQGTPAYGALDLSSKDDFTCFSLYFPEIKAVKQWFWVPLDTLIERQAKSKGVPYQVWKEEGYLSTTPSNTIDYSFILSTILEQSKKYDVKEIAFDPWNATQISLQLKEQGLEMIDFGQTIKNFNEPCKQLEVMIKTHELRHNNNPVLRWMASNAFAVANPAGDIKISKKSSSDKVDGMVCLAMCLARAMQNIVAVDNDCPQIYQF